MREPAALLFDEPVSNLDASLHVNMRPEHMQMSTTEGLLKGRVGLAEHLGSDIFIHVHHMGLAEIVSVRISGDMLVKDNDTIYLSPDMEEMHKFDHRNQGIH